MVFLLSPGTLFDQPRKMPVLGLSCFCFAVKLAPGMFQPENDIDIDIDSQWEDHAQLSKEDIASGTLWMSSQMEIIIFEAQTR